MGTPAVVPVAAKISFWSKAWHDLTVAEHAVVSAFQKIAGAVPEAEKLIAEYGPEVGALMNQVSAGSGKYATTASNAAATIGQLLEDGGATAKQNFLNVGFDETLIADIQGLWSNLKKAAASSK